MKQKHFYDYYYRKILIQFSTDVFVGNKKDKNTICKKLCRSVLMVQNIQSNSDFFKWKNISNKQIYRHVTKMYEGIMRQQSIDFPCAEFQQKYSQPPQAIPASMYRKSGTETAENRLKQQDDVSVKACTGKWAQCSKSLRLVISGVVLTRVGDEGCATLYVKEETPIWMKLV